MTDWVITVPKRIRWEDYELELEAVADGSAELLFRIPHIPRDASPGDRCFVVWDGKVRGWMEVTDWRVLRESFTCETTSTVWLPGKYVARTGPFHEADGPEMRGFQGIRRFNTGDAPNG